MSTVEAVVEALRREILESRLPGGTRLIEQDLTARLGVARHTLRAALRQLATEGLVRIEPNRGARVARLSAREIVELYELRTALELEGARLALERNRGRLPASVHDALASLVAACDARAWGPINAAHSALHGAIVAAGESPRITAAHHALDGELQLFMAQLEPLWSIERMAADHAALVAGLERDGVELLRAHLAESAAALVAAEGA